MRRITLLIIILFGIINTQAQTVKFVGNEAFADITIYITDDKDEADVVIRFAYHPALAQDGVWATDPLSKSKIILYPTKDKSKADFIVYLTKDLSEVRISREYIAELNRHRDHYAYSKPFKI